MNYFSLTQLNVQPGDVVAFRGVDEFTISDRPRHLIHSNGRHNSYGPWDTAREFVLRRRAAQPKPFGQLTRAEQGELLLAAHEGKPIQWFSDYHKTWFQATNPEWGFDRAYRVRPEPVVKQVALCYREDNGQVKNKIGTVNLVNGVVDPDSAKFDGVAT